MMMIGGIAINATHRHTVVLVYLFMFDIIIYFQLCHSLGVLGRRRRFVTRIVHRREATTKRSLLPFFRNDLFFTVSWRESGRVRERKCERVSICKAQYIECHITQKEDRRQRCDYCATWASVYKQDKNNNNNTVVIIIFIFASFCN